MEMEQNASDEEEEPPMLVNMDGLEEEEEAPGLVPMAESPVVQLPPCPVTILSGFLGAGKTTLIQYILRSSDHGKRIAVIENEFGGEGLSVETMIARDGANQDSLSELIELPNGCICCTVKDSLVTTLENLLEKRTDLDYILIEASGMANPGPIASLFWLDSALESRLRLDGVVTLVDAYHIAQQLKETEEAAQQIAYADRILLNKVDLLNHDQLQGVEAIIRDIHPTVAIRPTSYAQIPDLEWILDANCFDVDHAKEVTHALSRVHTHSPHPGIMPVAPNDLSCLPCQPIESGQHLEIPHKHTSAVHTVALVQTGSVDLALVNAWLASILWPNQDENDKVLRARLEQQPGNQHVQETSKSTSKDMQIFRIKGILSVRHANVDEEDTAFVDEAGLDARRFIVQAVHDLWEIHPASEELRWDRFLDSESGSIPSVRSCKIVVIGKFLRDAQLRNGFSACFGD